MNSTRGWRRPAADSTGTLTLQSPATAPKDSTIVEPVLLTAEQGAICTEDWIRMEFQARHDELLRVGEDEKIGAFVRAAQEARRRLEGEIEVNDEDEEEWDEE